MIRFLPFQIKEVEEFPTSGVDKKKKFMFSSFYKAT